MSTVGNGLGASQNAAAQSQRDEAIDAIAPRATGKIAFGANPMNDSTVTLNGTAVTFSASPSAGQVQIGSTLAATLQNLIAALEVFADANIMLMEYFANASNLYDEALAARRGMLSQSPPACRPRQAEPHPARLSRMDH